MFRRQTVLKPDDSQGHGSIPALARGAALTLMLLVLWCLTHHFEGLSRDGALYGVQAMARINPILGLDVYLANTSQDRFTMFSRLYAAVIEWWGLRQATLLLFLLCTSAFLASAWTVARALLGSDLAWPAVLMLILTTGLYGAYSVFNYSESYLTARSLAEALVVIALAVHVHGRKYAALAVAVVAMFVHPLMALPGLLLLIFLMLPRLLAIAAAALGCLTALAVALAAPAMPPNHILSVMDSSWLEVVKERSQFLFLRYWHFGDWEIQARPFLCLTLSMLVFEDDRIRRLCAGAMLVGAAGLIVALIAGSVGPVPILLQGQAWRWFWITGFVSVLLLAPTAVRLCSNTKCGPLCAVLIIAGWTFTPVDGIAMISLALLLWALQPRIDERTAKFLRWAAYSVLAIIVLWTVANSWSVIASPRMISGKESLLADRMRSVFAMQVTGVMIFGLYWHFIRGCRSALPPVIAATLLAGSLWLFFPGTIDTNESSGTTAEIAEFADWRDVMTGPGSVLLVPTKKSVAFVWFTLKRPSYISISQSAGVVFARATALEIHRRSDVLLPIMKPDWQIFSQIAQESRGQKLEDMTHPLTARSLAEICVDPQLGYVVAKEQLGFDAVRHAHPGAWKDWYLYDCRRLRDGGKA